MKVGLRQGCVMSLWLFNVFMDSVIRGMNSVGKGVELVDQEGRWEVSVLLFADDAVLISNSGEKVEELANEFGRMCNMKGLKINAGKSKVLWVKNDMREELDREREWPGVQIGEERLENVSVVRYLGMDIGARGGMEEEIIHRMTEGMKALGGLKEIWKKGRLSREVKVKMLDVICVLSVLYGCETWLLNAKIRRRVEVFEMNGLRTVCKLRRIDRVRNDRIRTMHEWNKGIVKRAE